MAALPAVFLVGHDRFAVLALGRRVAAEMAAGVLDPEALLTKADREHRHMAEAQAVCRRLRRC